MSIEILMPALSPTMEEGKLAKWLVKEGDEVHSGDILAEIETDKATMEFEAVDEGKIGKILVPEGTEGVKVNQPIAELLVEGENPGNGVDIPTAMLSIKDAVVAEAKPVKKSEAPLQSPTPPLKGEGRTNEVGSGRGHAEVRDVTPSRSAARSDLPPPTLQRSFGGPDDRPAEALAKAGLSGGGTS